MQRTWTTRLAIGATAAAVMALLMVLSPQLVASGVPLPDLVDFAQGSFQYRVGDDFTRGGRAATAPIVAAITPTHAVMRHQVTVGEYRRCADAGACRRGDATSVADVPMVKVSWWDAADYAAWLSRSTGMSFRLPSDEEWVYVAGSRFRDSKGGEISTHAILENARSIAMKRRRQSRMKPTLSRGPSASSEPTSMASLISPATSGSGRIPVLPAASSMPVMSRQRRRSIAACGVVEGGTASI